MVHGRSGVSRSINASNAALLHQEPLIYKSGEHRSRAIPRHRDSARADACRLLRERCRSLALQTKRIISTRPRRAAPSTLTNTNCCLSLCAPCVLEAAEVTPQCQTLKTPAAPPASRQAGCTQRLCRAQVCRNGTVALPMELSPRKRRSAWPRRAI